MLFSLIFWLILLFSTPSALPEEVHTLTITPQSYSKIIIRIPTFEGDSKDEDTSLLRSLINYHLFCLALREPPLPGLKTKELYLKGRLEKKPEGTYIFQGELLDLLEQRILKIYKIEATSSNLLIYTLADQIIRDISPYEGISFSRLAFVKRSSVDTLYLMDFSKKNLKRIRSANLILFPKFSPSGKKLAYLVNEGGSYFIEIYSLTNGEKKEIKLSEISSPPLFSPDEKNLYLSMGKQGEVNIYQLSLEDQKLSPIIIERGVHQVGSISPDGKWLAYVGDKTGKPQVYLLNLETGKSQRISFEGNYNTSPRFSPTKPILLYLSGRKELIFYSLKNQTKKRLVLPYEISDLTFSPTGDYLIFKGKGKRETGIFLLHIDSNLLHLYLPFPNLYYPDWGKY